MHKRAVLVLFIATLVASSAFAQSIDYFVRRIEATKEGETHVHGGVATVGLDTAKGKELGVDIFWSPRISTELSVATVDHELDASAFGTTVDLGTTRFKAYTGILSFHLNPRGTFDFHVGAGAARVTFQDLADNAELTLLGVHSIQFHKKIAPVLNAGAAMRLGSHWALTADAKWLDLETDTTATYLDATTEGAKLNLKQVSLGAGLSYRF